MLKETETEETIGFFVTFLSLVAFQLGERALWASLGYAYDSKLGTRFLNSCAAAAIWQKK